LPEILDRTLRTMWSPRRLTALAFTLGCILASVVLVGAFALHTSNSNCQRVARIDTVFQQQGRRGLATLGTPAGVGYAYYRAHPRELHLARAQLRQQIRDFRPPACSGIL